jgi:hypothetical protein
MNQPPKDSESSDGIRPEVACRTCKGTGKLRGTVDGEPLTVNCYDCTASATSPADGPAKVFGRAPLPTSAMPGEATHILALENLCFQWFAGNGVYLDADKDSSGNAEALAIATLSALLSLIPAEQVVQAMAPDLQLALFKVAQHPFAGHYERVKAWGEETARLLNEALARAEKAERLEAAERLSADANEELLVIAGRSGLREKERAEQAERERDEARELLRRAIKYAHEDRMTTPSKTRLARVLGEAQRMLDVGTVPPETNKAVTYNG